MKKNLAIPSLILAVLTVIAFLLYQTLLTQQESLKIEKEQHIIGVYSTYKSNIDSCIALARQSEKDRQFVKENCIDAINSSLVGKSLVDWGRSDLLVTEVTSF